MAEIANSADAHVARLAIAYAIARDSMAAEDPREGAQYAKKFTKRLISVYLAVAHAGKPEEVEKYVSEIE